MKLFACCRGGIALRHRSKTCMKIDLPDSRAGNNRPRRLHLGVLRKVISNPRSGRMANRQSAARTSARTLISIREPGHSLGGGFESVEIRTRRPNSFASTE